MQEHLFDVEGQLPIRDIVNDYYEGDPSKKKEGIISSLIRKLSEKRNEIWGFLSKEDENKDNLFCRILFSNSYGFKKYENLLEERIFSSQILSLWYLLPGGGLDDFFANSDLEDTLENRSIVATQILEQEYKKNQEDLYYDCSYTPSMGLEVEHLIFPVNRKRVREEFTEDGLVFTGIGCWRYLTREMIKMYEERVSPLESLNNTRTVIGAMQNKEEILPDVEEVITKPVASYKMALREIMKLIKSHRLKGDLYTQLSFGDIDISKEHPEALILTALMYASQIHKVDMDTPVPLLEKYVKPSCSVKEGCVYIPFHRKRILPSYRDNEESTIYPYKKGLGIHSEFRASAPKNFEEMARYVYSAFFISSAILANQKDKKDLIEQELSAVWNDLEDKFLNLLNEYHVDLGIDDSIVFYYDQDKDRLPYSAAIGKIAYLANTQSDFRERAYELVIDSRARSKKIIAEGLDKSSV